MIQIRNVPEALHEEYRRRAAEARMTLSDYLLAELERGAQKPTLAQWMKRLETREPVQLDRPVADILREERAKR